MQVINHGVPGQVMGQMMSSAEEFFGLPTEEKMLHYSTDSKKLPRFHTSIGNEQEKLLHWRDCLKLGCYPLEQFRHQWPQKPARLRAALEAHTTAVRAVALRLLRLTAAGLGLDEGHFEGELSAGPVIMNVNHYVACPDPSLTMGLAPHGDPQRCHRPRGQRRPRLGRRRGAAGRARRQLRAPDGGGQQRRPAGRRAPRGDERARRADVAGHVRHARDGLHRRGGARDGPRRRGPPVQAVHVPGVHGRVRCGDRRQGCRAGTFPEQGLT
ncbi:hypothetical protein PVAP13_1NG555100 [Panicum virgatum]|uniref:Non-haem dioxygenase N-terminal domain-containing protein n=1 Tax=Panicum virgatum TaxID=38727 RepID=A0A8T0XAY3_PANVG|nr:hypothetical protein PVAP13_1NG555100 [Panicum virgatum]